MKEIQEKNKLDIEQLKILLNEEKEKNKNLNEIQAQNEINLQPQLKLKTSEIDSYIRTINSKDDLIQKIKNDYMLNEEKQINRLNYDNDEMENDIYILQAESDKLNEKIKPKQKIKNDTKINEKEKFFITEEIKNNENADKIKEENKEINKDLKNKSNK